MQRSRKALLQRRVSEKAGTGRNCFYKFSLSLVFVLWGFVFLSSLWISQSDGYIDGSAGQSVGLSTWKEKMLEHIADSDAIDIHQAPETSYDNPNIESCLKSVVQESASSSARTLDDNPCIEPLTEVDIANSVKLPEKLSQKTDRLSRAAPLRLDDFKSKAFNSKSKSGVDQAGRGIHRVEPEGKEYNYASSLKGAKVLGFNKEAKGASNILSKDKDKYLRNPCSADDKFVVIELSEETLVDTIEIANFEHYSSNLKDFELLGSLVYPTDSWMKLGNFTASNVKLVQRFTLSKPKWVRYLKLRLLSHYGMEFYCTLSAVEVYGIDAVESMLEDLISAQSDIFVPQESVSKQTPEVFKPVFTEETGGPRHNLNADTESNSVTETSDIRSETSLSQVPDPVEEVRQQQPGRMPGDTVLKILMQKVRSLDLNLAVLERYLDDLNSRYGNIFQELDKEIEEKDVVLEKIRLDIQSFIESKDVIAKDVGDLISWKSFVSIQLDNVLIDNAILRSEVEKVRENQESMENKSITVFLICFIFGVFAILRLSVDIVVSLFMALQGNRSKEPVKFCQKSTSWPFLLLNLCCYNFCHVSIIPLHIKVISLYFIFLFDVRLL